MTRQVPVPSLLNPLLAVVERIDRRVRRIRPVSRDGVGALELRRHRGPALVLRDGTRIQRGDRVGVLHAINPRLRALARDGFQARILELGRADLVVLAGWVRRQPPDRRPVAYRATSVLWPFAHRVGFEIRERPRTAWVRFEDWYLRTLLVRWAGRERLAQGHAPLRSREAWLSADELEKRFGAGSAPAPSDAD